MCASHGLAEHVRKQGQEAESHVAASESQRECEAVASAAGQDPFIREVEKGVQREISSNEPCKEDELLFWCICNLLHINLRSSAVTFCCKKGAFNRARAVLLLCAIYENDGLSAYSKTFC